MAGLVPAMTTEATFVLEKKVTERASLFVEYVRTSAR
jgi:hypothetical protein